MKIGIEPKGFKIHDYSKLSDYSKGRVICCEITEKEVELLNQGGEGKNEIIGRIIMRTLKEFQLCLNNKTYYRNHYLQN